MVEFLVNEGGEVITEQYKFELDQTWALQKRALEILELVVYEWESDINSVYCFDLRIVKEASQIIKSLNKLKEGK